MTGQLTLLPIAAIFLVFTAYAGSKLHRTVPDGGPGLPWLGTGFCVLLFLRLALAMTTTGYSADLHTFQAWAIQAARDLPGFYSGGFFADYPPGYMYVLFLIGKLKVALSLGDGSRQFLWLIKLPAIFADMATVVVIYRLAAKGYGRRKALIPSLIYGINPAVIVNSSVWGQVDAVFTLPMALSVLWLRQHRLNAAVAALALAVLIKPQALIFSPLFLCVLCDQLLNHRWKAVLQAAATGLALFAAAVLPFAVREGAGWIFHQYGQTLTSYPYASVNAFNLFALCGGNFIPETTGWLALTFKTWGTVAIVAVTSFTFAMYFAGQREGELLYLGMLLVAAVFVLASRMHERYLFPALLFSLLATLDARDLRLLALFAGYSVTNFVNVALVLLASTEGVYQIPSSEPLLQLTAAVNLLLLASSFGYGVIRLLAPVRGGKVPGLDGAPPC